ncbi:MAG: hypothetical protein F6J90_24225 [Moorea sp. SIOASIH]|uniref:hypothetical protein n=1 Tax=Moorena sp. SIOASIH TaxID=2607817 RepID=UPI0013BA0F2B|nr:hypothetical protein [Moorena sp. SIOASIH]NEO39274.1 hypothetical protein [Moorena sp. SIOASIH]
MRTQVTKFPIPNSRFPIPYSLLPTPYSLLPTPYSLLPTPHSTVLVKSHHTICDRFHSKSDYASNSP